MLRNAPCRRSHDPFYLHFFSRLRPVQALFVVCGLIFISGVPLVAQSSAPATVQPAPAVVQPGAPGKPTRKLPASTTGTLPPKSHAEAEFMQGMIMHHAQAVEMTALLASRTENKDLRSLGARIRSSQSDEIKFMRRWLAARGEPVEVHSGAMPGMHLMPGMLTPEQVAALRNAKDTEFDRLFLTG